MNSPLISLITLTHNKSACTKLCLPTLLNSSPANWELIVVDNGSTDDTISWLHEFKNKCSTYNISVSIVQNAKNVGCSTARNQGAEKAKGKYFVFMDNDVAVRTASWLEKLMACMESDKKTAIVGPKLVYPLPPYKIQCAGVAISPSGRPLFRGRGCLNDAPEFNKSCTVQALISACFMVKADIFRKTGGFDEAFNPVEYEDFDLCYKISSLGFKVFYCADTEMYHIESITTARTPSLYNTALIIRHGLLFKKRWASVFQNEGGPPDRETRWRKIPPINLDDIQSLPLIK